MEKQKYYTLAVELNPRKWLSVSERKNSTLERKFKLKNDINWANNNTALLRCLIILG